MAYYTTGYKDAAAKAGATSTDAVKALQKQLNSAGANLAVDGIWGKNTNTAYGQYGSSLSAPATPSTPAAPAAPANPSTNTTAYASQIQQLLDQVKNTPTATPSNFSNPYYDQLLELTKPKDDAYYKSAAQNAYTPQHNAQVEAAQQAASQTQLAYQKQLGQLERARTQSLENLNAEKNKSMGNMQTNLLRTGMARSSYAGQLQTALESGFGKAISNAETEYGANVDYVGQQQTLTTANLAQTEQRLKTDLAANLSNYEMSLRQNDKAAQAEAYQSVASSYDAWRQLQEQMKVNSQQYNTSTLLDALDQTTAACTGSVPVRSPACPSETAASRFTVQQRKFWKLWKLWKL